MININVSKILISLTRIQRFHPPPLPHPSKKKSENIQENFKYRHYGTIW